MRPEMCIVCNDKRKYERKVQDIRRIVSRLKTMANKHSINNDYKNNELLSQLRMHNQHIHFSCGHCYKINTMELSNLEHEMDILLVSIANNINECNKTYHDVLYLLQGTYSGKYRIFQSFCLKKFK